MGKLPTGARLALGAGLLLLLAARVAAVFTEAFNWDELSFLYRVERSLATGTLVGGGRPGLAVLPLMPIVGGCSEHAHTIHLARLLWLLVTTAHVAGVFVLLRELLTRIGSPRALRGAALGTALTCLTPVFYRWSLQVRTDQLALALATWGGVLLLRSRTRTRWAAAAGVLCGVGYLASQKAAYTTGLVAAFAAIDVLTSRPRPLRRALERAGLALGALAGVVGAFYAVSAQLKETQSFERSIGAGLSSLSGYGDMFGHTTYLSILRGQPLHLLLFLLLCVATVASVTRKLRAGREHAHEHAHEHEHERTPDAGSGAPASTAAAALPYAWTALLLGVAVAIFHRSSFAYFWMTLGAFLGMGLGLGLEAVLALAPAARTRRVVLLGSWAILLLLWLPAVGDTLSDTQAVQRDSYAFIERNFAPADRGMQLEGGLFCRDDPKPMPVLMLWHVKHLFEGEEARRAGVEWMRREARGRPLKFILGSHTIFALPFPDELTQFWREHYVPYYRAVMIPGRALGGPAGTVTAMDVLVPGRYRWVPASAPLRYRLDGREVSTAERVQLSAGMHEIGLLSDVRSAALVLDVEDPPAPDPRLNFYSQRQRAEIALARDADWLRF